MKVFKIKSVHKDYNGNTTITHSGGAFHFREEDVAIKEYTNNFMSKLELKSKYSFLLFWNWVISLSLGFYSIVLANSVLQIPIKERNYLPVHEIEIGYYFDLVIPYFIINGFVSKIYYYALFFALAYLFVRLIYFLLYRDFFQKKDLFILLKNNQSIQLTEKKKNWRFMLAEYIKDSSNEIPKERDYNLDSVSLKKKIEIVTIFAILATCIILLVQNYYGKNSLSDSILFSGNQDQLDKRVQMYFDRYENETIPNYLIFLEGMLTAIKLLVFIPIVSVSILFMFLFAACFFGSLFPGINLYLRMQSDFRETHKINKKYGPFSLILWVCILFELCYYFEITLIWICCIISLTLILEMTRVLILRKIEKNSERLFSIHSMNYDSDFNPLSYYFPILISLVLFIIPIFFALDPNFWRMEQKILVTAFFPLGVLNFIQFFQSHNVNVARKKAFRNLIFIQRSTLGKKGSNLEFVSRSLKDIKSLVYKAVKNDGLALQFASDELRNDKEIVLEAIKSNRDAIQFASDDLKSDPEILEFLSDKTEEETKD